MIRNEPDQKPMGIVDPRLQPSTARPRERPGSRTLVIRQASAWQSLAVLFLGLLLLGAVLLGHHALRGIDAREQETASRMASLERRIQGLESGVAFDSQRRRLLLGMRDQILRVNPRVSLQEAYRFSDLLLDATEKYPSVDPLLLLAIGVVESGYDPQARSRADARGLYQIWPSTGRLLVRALGWDYDETTLYDPEKNTQAAALYLDMLFSTYSDPQMVLAEYNGGPLNAGYFRAGVGPLAPETRSYVPRVLELYGRLKEEFERGLEPGSQAMGHEALREGKTLSGGPSARPASDAGEGRGERRRTPATTLRQE
jgi:hypothetical protein